MTAVHRHVNIVEVEGAASHPGTVLSTDNQPDKCDWDRGSSRDLLSQSHIHVVLLKGPTGVAFDFRSAAMSESNIQEKFKEKITAVRTVVPNRSNNEIVLVLQHFDNNVNKTVQAFMDGSAAEVLKEWNVPGKKKQNKKRKRKGKQLNGQVKEETKGSDGLGRNETLPLSKGGLKSYHVNGSANDDSSVDSLSEKMETVSNDGKVAVNMELHQLGAPGKAGGFAPEEDKLPLEPIPQPLQDTPKCQINRAPANKAKPRSSSGSHSTVLQSPTTTTGDPASSKKRGTTIEKSVKDLQRCTVSLTRYQLLIKEEMDASVKKVKATFAELQACIMDREVALMSEMDKVKKEAMEILDARQRRAEELKRLTDVAIQMSESQLAELRAEIKQFVSERKYDEDLGRSARFTGNIDSLQAQIKLFGEVSHPKNNYSTRSQCISSLTPKHLNPEGSSTHVPSLPSSLSALSSVSPKIMNQRDSFNIQKGPAERQNYQRNTPSGQKRGFYSRMQGHRLNESSLPRKLDEGRNSSQKGRPHDGNKNQHQHNKSRHKGLSYNTDKPLLTDSNSNGTVLPAEINSQSTTPKLATTVSAVLSDRVSQYITCPVKPETAVDTNVLSIPNRMTAVA